MEAMTNQDGFALRTRTHCLRLRGRTLRLCGRTLRLFGRTLRLFGPENRKKIERNLLIIMLRVHMIFSAFSVSKFTNEPLQCANAPVR